MTSIKELTEVDDVQTSDLIPIYRSGAGRTRSLSYGLIRQDILSEPQQRTLAVSASRNLTGTDANRFLLVDGASPVALMVSGQTLGEWPDAARLDIVATGTMSLAIAADTGVTIYANGSMAPSARYAVISLKRLAVDTWVLYGDIAP